MSLILVFIIPLSVVVALILTGESGTPAWQTKLNDYMAYQNNNNSTILTTRAVAHVSKPWNFVDEMSLPPWGDSVVFQTAERDQAEAQGITVSWQPVLTHSLDVDGRESLPYPPDDLWCVLLQVSGSQISSFDPVKAGIGSQYTVVFVGLHNDLYNGAWVVHESAYPYPSAKLNATLEEVGCKIELPEVKE